MSKLTMRRKLEKIKVLECPTESKDLKIAVQDRGHILAL